MRMGSLMKIIVIAAACIFTASAAFAHVVVAPQQSQPAASQIYKVRVHNEEKIGTTSIELDVPDGVTVTAVAPVTGGKFSSAKSGDRIVKVTWDLTIAAGKYVELAFTATNPSKATQVTWIVHQHMADGSVLDWSDKAGAHGKASTTKIIAADPPAPAK
jgi:uncharacterized protein YcnI